jgi:hypothetical protein
MHENTEADISILMYKLKSIRHIVISTIEMLTEAALAFLLVAYFSFSLALILMLIHQ